MNDETTKKASDEPSEQSLADMPDTTDTSRLRPRPGRGHHTHLRAGELVRIDADLLEHFGSADEVNRALREVVEAKRRTG
jgi:uncharacterized protein (DUF4415 family)